MGVVEVGEASTYSQVGRHMKIHPFTSVNPSHSLLFLFLPLFLTMSRQQRTKEDITHANTPLPLQSGKRGGGGGDGIERGMSKT